MTREELIAADDALYTDARIKALSNEEATSLLDFFAQLETDVVNGITRMGVPASEEVLADQARTMRYRKRIVELRPEVLQ